MVYRLKNWQFARDMMCSVPDTVFGIITQILDDMKIDYNKPAIEEMIIRATCITTQDGFEAFLNLWRNNISHEFLGVEENERFEKFLEDFDNVMDYMIQAHGREHQHRTYLLGYSLYEKLRSCEYEPYFRRR